MLKIHLSWLNMMIWRSPNLWPFDKPKYTIGQWTLKNHENEKWILLWKRVRLTQVTMAGRPSALRTRRPRSASSARNSPTDVWPWRLVTSHALRFPTESKDWTWARLDFDMVQSCNDWDLFGLGFQEDLVRCYINWLMFFDVVCSLLGDVRIKWMIFPCRFWVVDSERNTKEGPCFANCSQNKSCESCFVCFHELLTTPYSCSTLNNKLWAI